MVTAAASKNFFGTFDLQRHCKNNNKNKNNNIQVGKKIYVFTQR